MLASNLLINAFQTGKADELRNRSTKSETVPVYLAVFSFNILNFFAHDKSHI